MIRTWHAAVLLPFAILVGCSAGGEEATGSSDSAVSQPIVLTCNKLTVTTGKTGGQSVSALATKDLSGTTDAWNKYVELQPASSGFAATCTFPLPAGMTASSIASLSLRVNYRGPTKAAETWLFEEVTSSGSVARIGDNAFAQDWVWSPATMAFPGSPSDAVSNGVIRVNVRTLMNVDAADIDELVVLATPMSATTTSDAGTTTTSDAATTTTTDAGTTTTTDAGTTTTTGVWRPTATQPLPFSWQLSTTFQYPRDVKPGVKVYDLDGELTDAATVAALHALGPDVKVICYFDAGVYEPYRSDASKYPKSIIGAADQGWPGLYWVDIRQLSILMPILKDRMQNWCKAKGFDGIEPDETDVWTNNPGFPITQADNDAFHKAISDAAHAMGISVGLKNNTSDAARLEPLYDWALSEQCWEYSECDNWQASFLAKGKAVWDVEYKTTPNCATSNTWHMNAQKRDLDLVGPTQSGYVYQPCEADTKTTW